MKLARVMRAVDDAFDRDVDKAVGVYLTELNEHPDDAPGALDRFVAGIRRRAAAHEAAAAGLSATFKD